MLLYKLKTLGVRNKVVETAHPSDSKKPYQNTREVSRGSIFQLIVKT